MMKKGIVEFIGTFVLVLFGTGTSVNPARSIGLAIFIGGEAMRQLWLFILELVVGGVVVSIVSKNVLDSEK
ncbi:MAG: hypothetical protein RR942_18510 [Romboutsia sp.]